MGERINSAENVQRGEPPTKKEESPVPKSLSDPELAKLKFPNLQKLNQPFMGDVGKETSAQSIWEPTDRIHSPPEDVATSTKIILETDGFKILKFSTRLINEGPDTIEVADEMEVKKHGVIAKISGDTPATEPVEIAKITSETLDLVKNRIGATPSEVTFLTSTGYLEFRHEGQNYLASPRFIVMESSKGIIEARLKDELETNEKNLKNLGEQLGEIKTKDQHWTLERSFLIQRGKFEKKVNGGILFSVDFEKFDASSYSEEIQNEFKSLKTLSESLRTSEAILDKISDLKTEIEYIQETITNSTELEGKSLEGEDIVVLLNKDRKKLEIYDMECNKVGEEKSVQGALECQEHLPEGGQIVLKLPMQNPKENILKSHYNSNSVLLKTEHYNYNGDLLEVSEDKLGFSEIFGSEGRSEMKVLIPGRVLENIDEISKHPKADSILLEAVKIEGIGNLDLYNKLKRASPQNQNIIESGLSVLNLGAIGHFQVEVDEFLAGNRQLDSGEASLDLTQDEAKELKELLRFRHKMVQDGTELSRDESYKQGSANGGPLIWNDPRSRYYLQSEPSWIKWDSEEIKVLLDKNNPELSKKELMLNAGKLIYDLNEPINEKTVNNAIKTIGELREQYASVDVFKGRNIAFAANNEVLDSQFEKPAKDYHSFGRNSLVEAIKSRQGPGMSFTLVRDEEKINQDFETISKVITNKIENEELRNIILDELQTKAKQSDGIFTKKDLRDSLISGGLNYSVIGEIIGELSSSPEEKLEGLTLTKQKVLDSIINTPPPFTFVFDGHGSPDAIYISDGQLGAGLSPVEIGSTIKITPVEFAQAIIARRNKFESNPEIRDVYVFQNCLNANFIGKLDSNLGSTEKPIIIGASEYNQFSYYSYTDEYGAMFLSDVVLGVERSAKESERGSKIKDIINRQFLELKASDRDYDESNFNTNPGIYVPNEKGQLIQISSLNRNTKADLS